MDTVTYRRLNEANDIVVPQINALLRHLHGESLQHDVLSAADHVVRSITVVAEVGAATIVGMAVVVPSFCWTHVGGIIRNIVVLPRYTAEIDAIAAGMLRKLKEIATETHFTELLIFVNDEHQYRHAILEELGFKKKKKSFFRLGLH